MIKTQEMCVFCDKNIIRIKYENDLKDRCSFSYQTIQM